MSVRTSVRSWRVRWGVEAGVRAQVGLTLSLQRLCVCMYQYACVYRCSP